MTLLTEAVTEQEAEYIATHAFRCDCGHLLLLHDGLSCLLCDCEIDIVDIDCGCS